MENIRKLRENTSDHSRIDEMKKKEVYPNLRYMKHLLKLLKKYPVYTGKK